MGNRAVTARAHPRPPGGGRRRSGPPSRNLSDPVPTDVDARPREVRRPGGTGRGAAVRPDPRKTPGRPGRPAESRRARCRVHSFPFRRFHVLFNSLFKVLFIFPSRYLFAIGLAPVFSFRWSLPPVLGCNPKQPDSWKAHRGRPAAPQTGLSPSATCRSKQLRRGRSA